MTADRITRPALLAYDHLTAPGYHAYSTGFGHGEHGIDYYPPARWGGDNATRWGPYSSEYDRGYNDGKLYRKQERRR